MTYLEAKVELYAQLKRNITTTEYGGCVMTSAIVLFDKYTVCAACVRQYGDWYVNKIYHAEPDAHADMLGDALEQMLSKDILETLYDEVKQEELAAEKAAENASKQDEDVVLA